MLRYEGSMITKHSHATLYVTDQDRAKDFYVNKLGFEVRDDARMGDFRWLTVGPKTQPDACIILYAITPGPWMTEEHAGMLKKLVEAGAIGGGVLATDDCRREYEALKGKGVEFKSEPKEMPYGIEAVFRDDSGNWFSLTQPK
jgi:catechol 2,3-dioxygenase-like lactoylglutathione lyase family enzyme